MAATSPLLYASDLQTDWRFRHFMENIKLPVVTLDNQGIILFCNNFLLNLAGWLGDEILGLDWFDTFVPPDDRIRSRERFRKKMSDKAMPTHSENEIITRQGEHRLIAWDTNCFADSYGTIMFGTSIGRDITELNPFGPAV